MKDWLSKLHEFFLDREPFVVATTYAYYGSSPEKPGVSLFHSSKKTVRLTSSDFRYQVILKTATDMLAKPICYRTEKLTLGKVAGIDNGQCDVIYEYFDAQQYPDWLKKLRTYRHEGISSTLLREFDSGNSNKPTQTTLLRKREDSKVELSQNKIGQNKTGINCWMQKDTASLQLFRTIQSESIIVALIGTHPVAGEIQKQCIYLPIETVKLTSVDNYSSEHSIVIIMTTDHELDYQYCETLLKQSVSDDVLFIGCIGSKKKAQIFKDRLLQNGVSKSRLSQLHMPVGLAEIRGKQNSVVAASIVAQLMARHNW